MLQPLYEKFIQATSWLYERVYSNDYFFIDRWTFIHFWSGFMVMLLINKLRFNRPWLTLFLSLLGYEIFEILLLYASIHIFLVETFKDQITDVLIGIIGGTLALALLPTFKKPTRSLPFIIMGSLSYSFLSTGFFLSHISRLPFGVLMCIGFLYSLIICKTFFKYANDRDTLLVILVFSLTPIIFYLNSDIISILFWQILPLPFSILYKHFIHYIASHERVYNKELLPAT